MIDHINNAKGAITSSVVLIDLLGASVLLNSPQLLKTATQSGQSWRDVLLIPLRYHSRALVTSSFEHCGEFLSVQYMLPAL